MENTIIVILILDKQITRVYCDKHIWVYSFKYPGTMVNKLKNFSEFLHFKLGNNNIDTNQCLWYIFGHDKYYTNGIKHINQCKPDLIKSYKKIYLLNIDIPYRQLLRETAVGS